MLLLEPLETIGGIWLALSAVAFFFAAGSFFALAALCAMGLLAFLPSSAEAADFEGDCCADLEERVADLEATAARKGNKKVTVQLYGKERSPPPAPR